MRHATLAAALSIVALATLAPLPSLAAWAPPPCTGMFSDVPCSSQFSAWIEQLAADGISSGCAAGMYCPDTPVTRRQMAVFLERTMRGTATWPPRLVRVSAVRLSNGLIDPVASGQALRDAVAGIPTSGNEAPADGNPWLVAVGPGTFDMGSSGLTLPAYVHLVGGGRDVTELRSSDTQGVVELGTSTSLRDLTAKAAGNSQAVGIRVGAVTDVLIRDVAVEATGGSNSWGIYCSGSGVTVEGADLSVGGSTSNTGIYSGDGTTMRLRDSRIFVAGGTATKIGLFQGSGSLVLERTWVTVDGSATSQAGARVLGLELGAATGVTLTDLTASVSGAAGVNNVGVSADASTEARTFEIHRSTITGEDFSVRAASNVTVRVAESQLRGGPVSNGSGSVTCFAVYDETFTNPGINVCP
jgi:hypothetical protein